MRASVLSLLLVSADPELQAQLKQDLKEIAITVAKDLASVPRVAAKRSFDGVIVETKRGALHDLAEVQRTVDPLRTFILMGSRVSLRNVTGMMRALGSQNGRPTNEAGQDFCLEDYIESKLGDFVKGMKNSSARNLHPMLIKAVERPLIALALKETNGNQIQASHLLGMNRNTLRKRIAELRIPVKREKAERA
ncbi:MAG: helix-turn-helix domain-containing protein [Nitrospiraceae bacterium]